MLYWLNIAYTILFCIEMAAKVVAYGFLFGETAYIKSSWNILDGTNLPRPDLVSGHTRPRPYAPPPPTPQAPSSSAQPDAGSVARVAGAVPAHAKHVTVVVKLGKSDAEHQAAWSAALGDALRQRRDDGAGLTTVVVVDALTWRSALLLPRERKNVAAAQSAARDIARQLLGDQQPTRRLSAEMAEAVCVGHWAVTAHLQWRSVRRPVERYTNGRIV